VTELVISTQIEPGMSGYTYASNLTRAWTRGELSRMWLLGSRPVSGQVSAKRGGGLWKGLDRMPKLTTGLLDKLESVGVEHPSSYSDCYHQLAPNVKRLKHSYNGMFNWWSGGAWEEALKPGVYHGSWKRYDIRSAYRWASTLGLPDVATFRAWKRFRNPHDVNGLWVAYIERRDDLPNVFRRALGPVVISSEELRTYNLLADVVYGVTWTDTLPANYIGETLDRLPCVKDAGRAYWGRWIARDPLICKTANKTWKLQNRTANFIWGWLLVGRVRLRLWKQARYAVHVYVDEVLVPHDLPTGPNVGDWNLKETYPNGITVKRTGWYAPLGGSAVMHTGMAA